MDGLLVFPAGADSSLPPSSSIISFINAVAFFGSSSFDRHLRQLQPAFSFMLHVPAFCLLLKVKQGGLRQARRRCCRKLLVTSLAFPFGMTVIKEVYPQ